MRSGAISICALAAVLLSSGCAEDQGLRLPATLHRSESDYRADVNNLKKELEAVKTRDLILAARLDEQLARERRLSDQVNRLKFLNTQQRLQIEALAAAPLQRDASIRKVEQLRAEVDRLKQRVAELKAIIAAMKEREEPREQQRSGLSGE